jgi:signal peptidase I
MDQSARLSNLEPDLLPAPSPTVVQAALDLLTGRQGRIRLAVSGRSMVPLMREGDRVVVQLAPERVRTGDIVVVRGAQGLVVHRVVRKLDQAGGVTYLTKGDAAFHFDPPVAAPNVLGQVVALERAGQHNIDLTRLTWRVFGLGLALLSQLQGTLGVVAGKVQRALGARGHSRPVRWTGRLALRASTLPLRVLARVVLRLG